MKKRRDSGDDRVILEKVDKNGATLEPAKGAIKRRYAESLYLVLKDDLTPEDKERGTHWCIRNAPAGTLLIKRPSHGPNMRPNRGR